MAVHRATGVVDAGGRHELVPHHQIPEPARRRPVGDDERLVVLEHEAAVGVAGVARRPAEVGVGHLVGVGEFVCGLGYLVSERMRVLDPRADGERQDREHRPHPRRARPQRRRGFGVAVTERVRVVERLDVPADRPPCPRVGLIVPGHQHGGVGSRPEFEREVSVGADVEIVVTDDRDDPVRPRAGRRLVVGGHREVDAVALVAADPVSPLRVDGAHEVVGVGVVATPAAVRP